ncbi:hypothetical protein BROC_00002 [Candidatus Brocadiaceae bacterium]|nr:hypothetical protein BROC_00002 [Candidatus Brocadiaceae bacterium]
MSDVSLTMNICPNCERQALDDGTECVYCKCKIDQRIKPKIKTPPVALYFIVFSFLVALSFRSGNTLAVLGIAAIAGFFIDLSYKTSSTQLSTSGVLSLAFGWAALFILASVPAVVLGVLAFAVAGR